MTFLWPYMLWLLGLLPLCVAFYVLNQQRRRRYAASFGSLGLVRAAQGKAPGLRRHIPPALFLVGLAILIVAMARPQATVRLPRVEGTVILAFDVSGSMAAEDLQPSRMEAAKAAAQSFIQDQPPSVFIGVVAFSDSGFSVQPPTNDTAALLSTISRMSPQLGTSLASGIFASLNTIAVDQGETQGYYSNLTPEPTPSPTPFPQGSYTSAVIVLLTDGENTAPPDPFEAAQAAADRGVRIYPIGIGSAAGTDLTVNGFNVHTQLDEGALQQIAAITGGEYFHAATQEDLQTIYNNLDTQLVVKPEKMEITSLLAGASILVLLISGLLSLVWFSRLP